MSSNVKTAKRGDVIFSEGDKISSLILIQSGNASYCVTRPKKNVDIIAVGPGQIVGEQAFLGVPNHGFSLCAAGELKYMEIPIDAAKAQVEAAPQFLKMVVKSLADRLKICLNDLKNTRMEKDTTPCTEEQVPKLFGALFHAVHHKGRPEDEKIPGILTIEWVNLKQYCQRIFGESPKRLEQACWLLVKLKMASFEMGKSIDDPTGPEEIQRVHFSDVPTLESFFEFFQYYYFKGGAATILKYDDSCYNLLSLFVKAAEGLPVDRFGSINLEFPKVVEYFKTNASLSLYNGHFSQLEAKGLFAKRQTRSADGMVILSFDFKEWQSKLKIWKMLHEIEKWNEKGFVDMTIEEPKAKKKPGTPSCPTCSAEIAVAAKFCQECGAKIEAAVKPAA